jgi:sensor c-di-GMP phosphodiesterase-like protein
MLAEISDTELQQFIENELINPNLLSECKDLLRSQKLWKNVTNYTETSSHICIVIATILSFASGVYKEEALSFSAGCVSTISLSLLNFSKFANDESKERNKKLNNLLKRINIEPVPIPIAQVHQQNQTPSNSLDVID